MKVLYTRCSSLSQNNSRQKTTEENFDWVIEDKISGAVPFFERPGGKDIQNLLKKDDLTKLTCHSIDRMFRDAKDMMVTLDVFNENKVPIHFMTEGLTTLNDKLEKDPIVSMIIHITGIFSELTRETIRLAQAQGIAVAKSKNKYLGRKRGSKEDVYRFLSKPKNAKAHELLNKGYSGVEVAKIVGLHQNTITKIKKIGNY
jgi:DNA invertase Pin-like site-specific DNA recombinase